MQVIAIFVSLCLLFAKLQSTEAQAEITVECGDQQEVCECSSAALVCKFKLYIEEHQTFTSYRRRMSNGERGTRGYTYYFDQFGYISADNTTNDSGGRTCNTENAQTSSTFDFTFGNTGTSCSRPMFVDGSTYRLFIAVNGLVPGPTLIATEGQTMSVTVYNNLTSEGITIHWHGIHQRNTPWMDGVGFVSQAPITPGGRFEYRFKATPAGTHWYHSHTGAQRTDGLFGALIVKESNFDQAELNQGTFIDEPRNHTLTLLDWQREASLDLFVRIHSSLRYYPSNQIGEVPTRMDIDDGLRYSTSRSVDGVEVGPVPYWSGLINGRGRYNSTTLSNLTQFNVSAGQTYRFRLIGAQSLYAYRFEIYGHKLTVIATDGHFIEPVEVDYLIIHTGERYDFLLNASETVGNYWIRATTLETPESIRLEDREHIAEAVLHVYNDDDEVNPGFPSYDAVNFRGQAVTCNDPEKPCKALNCPFKEFPNGANIQCIHFDSLRALTTQAQSKRPVISNPTTLFFNFGFEGESATSAINGRNFHLPPTPYQTYPGKYEDDKKNGPPEFDAVPVCSDECNDVSEGECICTHVVDLVEKRYVEGEEPTIMIILSAVGTDLNRDFSHPIHLHGHSFYHVYTGFGSYSDGMLITNNKDVVCGDDDCKEPGWRKDENMQDVIPEDIQNIMNMNGGVLPNTAIRKDTIIVPAGGYVVIAFIADNPGYWFLHCHIEVHQLEGMAVIIREYPEKVQVDKVTYINHNPPPDGINKVGDFVWEEGSFNIKVGFEPGMEKSAAICPHSFAYAVFGLPLIPYVLNEADLY